MQMLGLRESFHGTTDGQRRLGLCDVRSRRVQLPQTIVHHASRIEADPRANTSSGTCTVSPGSRSRSYSAGVFEEPLGAEDGS